MNQRGAGAAAPAPLVAPVAAKQPPVLAKPLQHPACVQLQPQPLQQPQPPFTPFCRLSWSAAGRGRVVVVVVAVVAPLQ
jgi:hypothetical protein